MNDDARYAALTARDRRFDGVFFVGVTTTGVYCRPICPARTPGRARCQFFTTAALAEHAGFRACFRCRPEVAPGDRFGSPVATVDAVGTLVEQALELIGEGALNDDSLAALASRLGVSERHLRRTLTERLGVSPIELAQSHRLALAKQLLHDSELSLTEIAFAAGYGSVRRFNAAFVAVCGMPPSQVRRRLGHDRQRDGLVLRLDYRPPYDWDAMLAFLRPRAIPGVELVDAVGYRRVVHLPQLKNATGIIEVRHDHPGSLALVVAPELLGGLMTVVARVRRLFDLDAHPDQIAATLKRDRLLAPLVARRPGLRLPGAFDRFEAVIRAMVGQQVSVAAATTIAARFASALGQPLRAGDRPLIYRFPTATEVARATPDQIAALGMPAARAAAIHAVATAIDRGALDLTQRDLDRFVATATALPGIGPWTAHYIAMRALHLPDAFVAGDLGVRKALAVNDRAARSRAEAWRPFRAYAVMHLWMSGEPHVESPHHRVTARTTPPRRARRRGHRASSAAA